jgi:hypothetical protein
MNQFMTKYQFSPAWRKGTQDVEVVTWPDWRWFYYMLSDMGEGRRAVRFALMEDGVLYFGDAFHVLHHDIMQLRRGKIQPILVGIILSVEGTWRLSNVQYFGSSCDGSKNARGLLPTLIPWNEAVAALGSDPLALPNWGEEA